MTLPLTVRFNAAKLLQSDLNAWRLCAYQPCREKQTCLGGPRGTCARTLGWPACTSEGIARMKEARHKWQRSKTYDTETEVERSARRMERELQNIDIMMKTQGI